MRDKVMRFSCMFKNEVTADVVMDGIDCSVRVYETKFWKCIILREDFNFYNIMDLLEGRVIPRTRPDINEVLARHGLDHYDVWDLLHINHGATHDDDCWVRFSGEEDLRYEDIAVRKIIK